MKQRNRGRRTAKVRSTPDFLRKMRGVPAIITAASLLALILVLIITSVSSNAQKRKFEEEMQNRNLFFLQAAQENAELKSQLEAEAQSAEAYRQDLEKTTRAMDLFWQIDEAFVLNRHTRCRELIRSLEEQGLAGGLSETSTTDNGRFSPYDRYAEICEALQEPYGNGR